MSGELGDETHIDLVSSALSPPNFQGLPRDFSRGIPRDCTGFGIIPWSREKCEIPYPAVPCKMQKSGILYSVSREKWEIPYPVSRGPVKKAPSHSRTNASPANTQKPVPAPTNPAIMLKSRIPWIEERGIPTFVKLEGQANAIHTEVPSHRFNSLRSQVVFFFSFFLFWKLLYPILVSLPRPPVQRR